MRVTNIAVARAITVFAAMFFVILLGIFAYKGLPREAAPDVKIPYVMVYAPYYGTSPHDMENLVTRKIETELKGLPDLKEMTSTSSEGSATIVLEFTTDVDMIDALQKVRDAVELAKPELPQDVKDDLLVYELSSDDWPMMQVVLSGDYDPVLLKKAGEDLQEELEQIRGVLAVDLTGGVEREVRVDVDPERLRFYGLGLVDVKDAIALENVTIPSGDLSLGTYDYQVRVPGEFQAVDEILDIVINNGDPHPVYVRDVADVSLGLKDRETISRLDGVDAVTLSVKKRSGENIIAIADKVNKVVAEMTPTLPTGTRVQVVADNSVYVRDMVTELQNNILSGLILVVAVLFLFLGLTNSIFVGVAIPFSMLMAFITMSALGITLNMVALFSLILALGMLVDNAIVIVENIFRHRTEGKGSEEAALSGTAQVGGAVTASTLTTLCAFGPLAFWPGIMGEFMKYVPITVIITLSASLLVALIFNPVLCARFMRVPANVGSQSRFGDRVMAFGIKTYEPTIRWALRHKFLTLLAMLLVFIASLVVFAAFNTGVELFPDADPTYAYVSVEAPSGTRIELSDAYTRQVEEKVRNVPDLLAFVTQVGASGEGGAFGPGSAPPHLSLLTMEFVKKEYRGQSSRKGLENLRDELAGFTGATLYIEKQEEGPPTGAPINIEISGKDFTSLGAIADEVKSRIRDIPGLVDLKDNYDRGRPEIQVRPDVDKAGRFGLRTWDVASTVRTALHGEDVSTYRVGEDEYDIVVRYAQPARRSTEDIEEMTVFWEGESIPLTAFADVSYTTGLGAIHRIDGRRVVTVSADAATGFNGNAILGEVQRRLASYRTPPGYHISYTGESEDQEEAMHFIFEQALPIGLTLILLVLITQFGSVTVPFVIMSSVVMSMIGVMIGLVVTRMPFGIIMTGVGVISLAGIVVNNAIVLIDYVLKLRQSGLPLNEAIVQAGCTRFRPVMLTAITTILGLIPLTTGLSIDFNNLARGNFKYALIIGGESSQWWGPMGVAVIWGLAVATFLTLVIVPTMYATIESMKASFRRRVAQRRKVAQPASGV